MCNAPAPKGIRQYDKHSVWDLIRLAALRVMLCAHVFNSITVNAASVDTNQMWALIK